MRRQAAGGRSQAAGGRSQAAGGRRQAAEGGFTLLELLISFTLLSLLTVAIVMSLRVGLSAMNKVDTRLMGNRRVAGVERILEQEVAGMMPVTADCRSSGEGPPG